MTARIPRLLTGIAVLVARPAAAEDLFRDRVAPILEQRCVGCHHGPQAKGGLDLSTAKSALAGGESGAAIEPGQPADSLLIEYVSGDQPEMPKNRPPLKTEEIKSLRRWVKAGAVWPQGVTLSERRVFDADWWSLRPLARPAVPSAGAGWAKNPIDAFVARKLAEQNLAPSPEADRRTLIRRLTFDLHGLPPTPAEIEAFVADPAPDAYERLVDRMLASPRYGERWARHWLDVVHYGETHGYDKDQPRTHAWPYRDYVIRALNADKPFGRFAAEQLAGDVLAPGTRDGVEALGFISAGPWDLIGHAEVPEEKIDGKVARHLDRDDMVTNTVQTFVSLTVQCAQCHDHKFDPITQEDYYSLQAVFAAVDRTERCYDADPAVATVRASLRAQQDALAARKSALRRAIAERGGAKLAETERRVVEYSSKPDRDWPPEYGYHSGIEPTADAAKWVQVDLGKSVPLARVVVRPCKDDFAGIGAGFGFPPRYKIELSDDAQFRSGVVVVTDRTAADLPNPQLAPQAADAAGHSARYVRLTATRLAPRQNDFILAIAELEAVDLAGKNVARGAAVSSLDTIEAPPRWRRANLTDGLYPGPRATADELARVQAERDSLLAAATRPEERRELAQVDRQLGDVATRLAQLPPQQVTFVGAVHTGSGAFRGTGASGGRPRPISILARGSVLKPTREVGPGAIAAVPGLPARFELGDRPESARRAALADWITHPQNPLTWRSIANRLWHYHFGRGLAATPNDFGQNGQPPTHPELLDWLALELRDGGQSLKRLHRLILCSAVYRQSSAVRPEPARLDADNRWLWRMNRRKLEAEALRDSLLAVSGRLDPAMYGPSFQDFVIDKPEHSPHYEYHLHNPDDPRSQRRSVYRFIVRSQPQPFMTTLDCADPSMQVDRRNESLSSLQALALLNNALVVNASQRFAARLEQLPGDLPTRIERAHYEALGRPPTAPERAALVGYAQQHGLANLCRLLVNLNEFTFVD